MRHICFLLLLISVLTSVVVAQEPQGPERWEKTIQAFEKKIASGESKPGSVLFIGSSSIRMWDLAKWLPKHTTVNHGFGGSEVSDSLHYFDRIVTPLKPPMIVLYAGDNDIAKGKTAAVVHRDFTSFAKKVRQSLPAESKVAFVAIKPSIKRWNLSEEMNKANQLIAKDCAADDRLIFIDIWNPMLGEDGKPKPELFADDGLHLNDEGYKMWTTIVRRELPKAE